MAALNLILGDQLFEDLSTLPPGPIVMVEDRELASHARYHPQKLVLTFSAMRHFAARLGDRCHYARADQARNIFDVVKEELGRHHATELHTYEPADHFFKEALVEFASELPVQLILHDNPMFLTSKEDWEAYGRRHRRRLMAEFYIWQRRRLGILLTDSGNPEGGQWSFDAENRRRLPPQVRLPKISFCPPDEATVAVVDLVRSEFSDHLGSPNGFGYPVNHEQAKVWLNTFVEERLDLFGSYEDAISKHNGVIFHSLLTPMLNIGLLTPKQVIERVLDRHRTRPVPLNSLEGFLRQVIGWREFIRGIDRDYETMPLPAGPFRHSRQLNHCWYDGSTGLPPLDVAIRRALDHGYCHHIERLMVLGASMLMCEVSPEQAHRWFMEMFIDSAEWVMRPNVLGMSQFADGGYFATKPYICGSSYILKMSDYEKGSWCDVWDGLYWRFIAKNRSFFAANPRLSVMVNGVDRLDPTRRERIFAAAENFINASTTPCGTNS